MKNICKLLSLVLALTLMAGVLAGCNNADNSGTTTPPTTTVPPTDPTTPPATTADVIGKVITVNDSFLNLQVFTSGSTVEDYSKLDITTLTESQENAYAFTYSTTTYTAVFNGQQLVVKQSDIAVGDMVAVFTDSQGKQQVYIYAEKTVTPEPTTPPTTEAPAVPEPTTPPTTVPAGGATA